MYFLEKQFFKMQELAMTPLLSSLLMMIRESNFPDADLFDTNRDVLLEMYNARAYPPANEVDSQSLDDYFSLDFRENHALSHLMKQGCSWVGAKLQSSILSLERYRIDNVRISNIEDYATNIPRKIITIVNDARSLECSVDMHDELISKPFHHYLSQIEPCQSVDLIVGKHKRGKARLFSITPHERTNGGGPKGGIYEILYEPELKQRVA